MSVAVGLEYLSSERYFMSEELKDAQLGRLMRERRDSKEHLARLGAEAQRWSERLGQLASALKSNPEGIVPDGTGLDIRYKMRFNFLPSDFNEERLVTLTREYRQTIEAHNSLTEQLANLGHPVS